MGSCACNCGCSAQAGEPAIGEIMYDMISGRDSDQQICDSCMGGNHQTPESNSNDDPLTILKRRFASGDISREEYLEDKDLLE